MAYVEGDDWQSGQAPIGFNNEPENTVLDDMRRLYSGAYLRKEFTVDVPEGEALCVPQASQRQAGDPMETTSASWRYSSEKARFTSITRRAI